MKFNTTCNIHEIPFAYVIRNFKQMLNDSKYMYSISLIKQLLYASFFHWQMIFC